MSVDKDNPLALKWMGDYIYSEIKYYKSREELEKAISLYKRCIMQKDYIPSKYSQDPILASKQMLAILYLGGELIPKNLYQVAYYHALEGTNNSSYKIGQLIRKNPYLAREIFEGIYYGEKLNTMKSDLLKRVYLNIKMFVEKDKSDWIYNCNSLNKMVLLYFDIADKKIDTMKAALNKTPLYVKVLHDIIEGYIKKMIL
jgi:hypothetical protein